MRALPSISSGFGRADGITTRPWRLTKRQIFTWIASTVLGGYCGRFIAPGSFGIDYALSAMFLCLLVFQLQGRIHLLMTVFADHLATAISILLPGNCFVIIASVLGESPGFAIKRYALHRGWLNA